MDIDKLQRLLDYLSPFRKKFFSYSKKYKKFFYEIFEYLTKINKRGFNIWRIARVFMYMIVGYVVLFISNMFINDTLFTNDLIFHSTNFITSSTLEIMALHKFIIDKFYNLLQKTGIYKDYKRDIDIIIDEFDKSVKYDF